MGSYKLLKIIFIILILTVLGELSYYIYISTTNRERISPEYPESARIVSPPQFQLIEQPTGCVLPTPNPINPKEVDAYYKLINPNIAIDPKVIYDLVFLKKGILQFSTINHVFKGRIADIDKKGGKAFFDYYDYKLKLVLADINNDNIESNFYFSADDLSKTMFLKLVEGEESLLTLDELKIGDIIIIEDSLDALKAEPFPTSGKGHNYLSKSWGYNRNKVKIIKIMGE